MLFRSGFISGNFLLIIFLRFHFSLGFKSVNNLLFSPSNLLRKISELGCLSEVFDSENLEGCWDNEFLFLIIGVGNAFKYLKSGESLFSLLELVRNHSSDSSPEESAWRNIVNESSCGVGVSSLIMPIHLFDVIFEHSS